jgi:predicted DNA-binding WGR domain protein
MTDRPYQLYRYQNSDGSSKDWAIRNNGNSTYTKRWGKTGTRLQAKDFPLRHPDDVSNDISGKQRKGYQFIGQRYIDDDGNISVNAPISSKPMDESPQPSQQALRLFWRIKLSASATNSDIAFFQGIARGFAAVVLESFPDDVWVSAFHSRYSDVKFVKNDSGSLLKENGVNALVLLLAIKKSAPNTISVSLSHEDSVEITDQLKSESLALSFFDTDLESVRPLAQELKLLDKRIDLSSVDSEIADFYF